MDGSCRNVEKKPVLGLQHRREYGFLSRLPSCGTSPSRRLQGRVRRLWNRRHRQFTEVKYRRIVQITSEFHHVVGILFEDAAFPILVRFCQVAACYTLAKTETISLTAMRFHSHNQVSQLSLPESCPNIRTSSWFQHEKFFTYLLPS